MATSLIEREYVSTTLAKAKEVQRFAEKLITLGKKNTNATRARAEAIFYQPQKYMPKLFGTLRERYANRNGGYTRLLLSEPLKPDAAPSAILCLVDGPKDMRFSMTARALALEREQQIGTRPLTALNMRKVTRYREGGEQALEEEVNRLLKEKRGPALDESLEEWEWENVDNAPGKVKRARKDREEWERSDRSVPRRRNKKRV